MKSDRQHTEKRILFSGGIAEIVDHPTPLTFSFLSAWFSGMGAFGTAMRALDLPFFPSATSILTLVDGELFVDVGAEDLLLYSGTVLGYGNQMDTSQMPPVSLRPMRLLSPSHVWQTLKLIGVQSKWTANPDGIIRRIQQMVDSVETPKRALSLRELDTNITTVVIPAVIATGYVTQYFHQYCLHQSGSDRKSVNAYISETTAETDWIFHSVADQYLVKSGGKSVDWYMDLYGNRADRDFEITCPRWYEIPQRVKAQIDKSVPTPHSHTPSLDTLKWKHLADPVIRAQQIRSRAKQKALAYIALLRQAILDLVPDPELMPSATREQLLSGAPIKKIHTEITSTSVTPSATVQSGRGTPISRGTITGSVIQVTSAQMDIPTGTIAVFPNASPEYSVLFPKCAGIIFQKGGQTSHGAIVAREYGIPAIVEKTANSLSNHTRLTLDGELGTWQVLSN